MPHRIHSIIQAVEIVQPAAAHRCSFTGSLHRSQRSLFLSIPLVLSRTRTIADFRTICLSVYTLHLLASAEKEGLACETDQEYEVYYECHATPWRGSSPVNLIFIEVQPASLKHDKQTALIMPVESRRFRSTKAGRTQNASSMSMSVMCQSCGVLPSSRFPRSPLRPTENLRLFHHNEPASIKRELRPPR